MGGSSPATSLLVSHEPLARRRESYREFLPLLLLCRHRVSFGHLDGSCDLGKRSALGHENERTEQSRRVLFVRCQAPEGSTGNVRVGTDSSHVETVGLLSQVSARINKTPLVHREFLENKILITIF